MKLSAQIARNTLVQIIGKIISTALGLAALAVMTRYLKQDGFGQYTTVITFVSLFAILGDFGLTLVTSRMISQPEADSAKILNNLFSLRLISAILFLGLAPLMVVFLPYPPVIKLGAAIASLAFFFTTLNQILVGWFQKNLTMIVVAAADAASKIFLLAGVIAAAFFQLGLTAMLAATAISGLISFLIHYRFARRQIKISWQIDLRVWRDIIKKSWPLGITIFFNLIYLRADTLILSLLKNQGDVGLYGATYRIIDVLTALPFMFAGLILPILTRIWSSGDAGRFNQVLQRSLDAMFVLAIPLIIGAQVTAGPLMTLIAGRQFAGAGHILKILILAVGFIFTGCLLTHAAIALDKQKKLIAAYIFTAVTALAGYLILIPRYSYYGAAWVTVYSEAAVAIFSLFIIIKYSRFRLKVNIFLKSLLASLIMGAAIFYPADKYSLLFVMPLAAAVYLCCLYFLKVIKREDIKILFKYGQ